MSKAQFAVMVKGEGGEELQMLIESAEPLGFGAVRECVRGGRNKYPTKLMGRVLDAAGVASDRLATLSAEVAFNEHSPFFALVPGGVLPVQYLPRCTVLLDSNTTNVLGVQEDTKHPEAEAWRWVLPFLDSSRFCINPMGVAFEGNSSSTPELKAFSDELKKVTALIRSALPNAEVTQFSPPTVERLHGWRTSFDRRAERETLFLLEVAPLLVQMPAQSQLQAVESKVVQAASKHGLSAMSLVVITSLAVLYSENKGKDGEDGGAGRRLLKPSASFREQDAYNALADLRQLELLAMGRALPTDVVLLTGDIGLALLWCGLGHKATSGSGKMSFSLSGSLFPKLPGEHLRRLFGSD